MDLPEENTVVVNMMGEFNALLCSKFDKSKQDQMKRKRAGERLSENSRIIHLECQLDAIKTSNKRARIEADRDQNQERIKKKLLEEEAEDQRKKMSVLVKRDEKIREEFSLLKSSKDALRMKYEEQIKDLKQKKLNLENALQDMQMTSRSQISKLTEDSLRKDQETMRLKADFEYAQTQIQQYMRKAAKEGANRRAIEEYKVELFRVKQENKELLRKIEGNEDSVSLARAVGNDLKRLAEIKEENKRLSKENEYLRATNDNNHLLKEKVLGLEAKLARTEKRLSEVPRLQVNNEELQEKNTRLEVLNSTLVSSGAEEVKQNLKQLQELQEKITRLEMLNSTLVSSGGEEVKQKMKQLQETNQSQAEVIQMYEDQKNMRGDCDSSKSKVLTFSLNPAAELRRKRAESEKNLLEEVEMLRERVRMLEGGNEANTHEIKELLKNNKAMEDLKKDFEASELRAKRLKEIFKRKIQEFREACCQLTGYLISNPTDNQYSLISIYAEQQTDRLLFRSTLEGEMQLLENEFSSSLPDLIESYLKKQDSIPAFLSNLTLDLFSKQTTMVH